MGRAAAVEDAPGAQRPAGAAGEQERILRDVGDEATEGMVVDRIQRLAFDWLDAPVARVCYDDVPFAYAENLEHLSIPQPEDIHAAVRAVAYRN